MTLVNGYPAFKCITGKEQTLCEFTNGVALAKCAKVVEGEEGPVTVAAATHGARQASAAALEARMDPGDVSFLSHSSQRTCQRIRGEGPCRVCLNKHASDMLHWS